MTKRVHIVDKTPRSSFGERLEAKAGAAVRRDRAKDRDFSITWTIERELALTLSHLNRTRSLHKRLHLNLLHQECYLDTEIMQREPRPHDYIDVRLRERDRLRDRLREIEKERRRLWASYEENLRALHDRLLVSLNRHGLLE